LKHSFDRNRDRNIHLTEIEVETFIWQEYRDRNIHLTGIGIETFI